MSRERFVLPLLIALAGAACSPDGAEHQLAAGPVRNGALDDTTSADTSWAASTANLEPGALRGVVAEPVHGRTGPDGLPFEVALRTPDTRAGHARRFGMQTLQVQLRTGSADLVSYPCTSCHAGRTVVMVDERISDAHSSIAVVHPRETGATCRTCHAPDDVELLALRTGERASLDHAYRVCAQCHFAQVDAWAAGAHGKRLDGWQGRRVVMGCADCHDPHAPALVSRLPFRPPRLHRPGSRQP
jgi:hypothetical protein